MIELKFTQPIPKGDQWVVTLHGPDLDIRYALHSISSVPGIPGVQMIRSRSTPERAEIRVRGEDSWAIVKDYLGLEFKLIPIP